jgi:predicted nucleic acid-binding protein
MSTVVDTCVLIDALLGVTAARAFLSDGDTNAISRITWMEVMVGARDPSEERTLRAFLSSFQLLEIDEPIASEAVRLRRAARLKLPDAIIFATAQRHRLPLATRNTRDFPPGTPGVVVPYVLVP